MRFEQHHALKKSFTAKVGEDAKEDNGLTAKNAEAAKEEKSFTAEDAEDAKDW